MFAPRKPLIFLPDCLPWGFLAECGPKGVQGGERKATLLASIDDNFAVSNSPLAGIDAPTAAREQGLQPYGALYCFEWRSEGGAGGRAESPPACSAERNLCRGSSPLAGPDAPTPAREKGLQPYGALTLFFRWRKKSVQKKASGTATLAARPAARRGLRSAVAPSGLSSTSVRFAHPPGKSPLLPIFERGSSQCRAQWSWTAFTCS